MAPSGLMRSIVSRRLVQSSLLYLRAPGRPLDHLLASLKLYFAVEVSGFGVGTVGGMMEDYIELVAGGTDKEH